MATIVHVITNAYVILLGGAERRIEDWYLREDCKPNLPESVRGQGSEPVTGPAGYWVSADH